jgi:hypothetical protein
MRCSCVTRLKPNTPTAKSGCFLWAKDDGVCPSTGTTCTSSNDFAVQRATQPVTLLRDQRGIGGHFLPTFEVGTARCVFHESPQISGGYFPPPKLPRHSPRWPVSAIHHDNPRCTAAKCARIATKLGTTNATRARHVVSSRVVEIGGDVPRDRATTGVARTHSAS